MGHMRMRRAALDEDAPGLQAEVREQPPDLRKPGTHSVRPAERSPERVLTRERKHGVGRELRGERVEPVGVDQPIGTADLPSHKRVIHGRLTPFCPTTSS
jgi:hypothetical protein